MAVRRIRYRCLCRILYSWIADIKTHGREFLCLHESDSCAHNCARDSGKGVSPGDLFIVPVGASLVLALPVAGSAQ